MVWIKRLLVFALITLVIIQFFRPERNNDGYEGLKPFLAATGPSEQVQGILKMACYDCHSDQTNYPWYTNVAPVSFYLNDHIKDGKRHLNFSAWDSYSVKRKDKKLKELGEEVEYGDMPLESYSLIHRAARLSPAQAQALVDWAKTVRLKYALGGSQPQ